MPYIVNFTDSDNKTPITVYDNTSSTDTSLIFPGRNVTGYGQPNMIIHITGIERKAISKAMAANLM